MVVVRRASMASRLVLGLSRRCMVLGMSCEPRLVDEVRPINKGFRVLKLT